MYAPLVTGPRFVVLGAAGFVAPRHLAAIRDIGGTVVAVVDPHDSVGIIDSFFPGAVLLQSDLQLQRLLQGGDVDWLTVCTPNHLHARHVEMGLRAGCSVICEKPLAIDPAQVDRLRDVEAASPGRVNVVMQLRHLGQVSELIGQGSTRRAQVELSYITQRGRWYDGSWKGDRSRSGGLIYNIGIHLLDMLVFVFGRPLHQTVTQREPRRLAGLLELEHADVRWRLSICASDLPAGRTGHAFRQIRVDGQDIDLSPRFEALHSVVYREVLAGRGWGLDDVEPAIQLAAAIASEDETSFRPQTAQETR